MHQYGYTIWIPLLPLAVFLLLGLFGKKYLAKSAGILGVVSMLAATVLSLMAAQQYFFVDGKMDGVYQKLVPYAHNWLEFCQH